MKKLIILIAMALSACGPAGNGSQTGVRLNEMGVPQYEDVQNGGVKMISVDGKYNVWTKRIGNGAIKVLLLHGGPAFTHNYFECFENFFPQAGIEFYYYDQLGCGNSDIPTDTSLWRSPRYVEEVEPLMRSFKMANMPIYIQMQGVDEFHITGNFKNWEMWDRLPGIKTPTLVLGGMNDEMNPEDMKEEARLLPNSRLYLCPNGSHMSMYDDQQNYFNALISFLKDVEGGRFTPDTK